MDWIQMRHWLRRMDWSVLVAVGALMVMGVLFIYSASYRTDDVPIASFYRKQILWVGVALFVFFALVAVDYHAFGENADWIYVLCLVLLVLVLVIGKRVYGANRWLSLFGMRVQPSEFAKLGTLIAVARYLGRPGRNIAAPGTTLSVLLIMALPFVLILKEPDLGTAMVLVPMTLAMLFVAGVPVRTIAFIALLGVLVAPFGWLGMSPYQKDRIMVFFDPGRDPLGAGWNKIQSEIAVGSGGLLGKGYLKGTQNVLGFLPRTVAPTDFIYSVIAEETGFAGSVVILVLFAFVIVTCIRSSVHARDKFGRLLAVGVATLLFFHVFVNIAMTIGLMPITGLPLPLMSYGGSFMVSTMAALGMVQSVYARRHRR